MSARILALAAASLLAFPGGKLATDYSADRSLHFELQSSMEMETTSSKFERDGQPVEAGFGGASTSSERQVSWTDKVMEHKDGAPTKVRRTFGDSTQTSGFKMGDREDSRDQDSALNGVTLELTAGDDGVEAKVVEGSADGDALHGHRLELLLDSFLPDADKSAGDSWDVEADQIKRGLALDLGKSLFPPPQEDTSGGGGGGRGRGGFGRGGGGSSMLTSLPWEGKATLEDGTEEYDGASCRVIKLEFEAEGQLEEPSFGGGRGRAFGIEPAAAFETNAKAEVEGKLLFDEKAKLPVRLELRGKVEVHTKREFEGRDGGTMKMESTQEGEFKLEASVSVEKKD